VPGVVFHVIVGAVLAAAIVTVWVMVADEAPTESTACAVKVTDAGPTSEVVLPESLSVPLPPPT